MWIVTNYNLEKGCTATGMIADCKPTRVTIREDSNEQSTFTD